jgi:hypothetical protein
MDSEQKSAKRNISTRQLSQFLAATTALASIVMAEQFENKASEADGKRQLVAEVLPTAKDDGANYTVAALKRAGNRAGLTAKHERIEELWVLGVGGSLAGAGAVGGLARRKQNNSFHETTK